MFSISPLPIRRQAVTFVPLMTAHRTTRRDFVLHTGLTLAGAPLLGCTRRDPPPTEHSTMPIQLSPTLTAQTHEIGGGLSVNSLDLTKVRASPVLAMDDFRVAGRPFPPHPHAGFSAITYVFPDSPGSLRNRDSLGGHVVVGPGGICWLQAGDGAMHEEIPADKGKALHGLQVFVNSSAKHKHVTPKTFSLERDAVPEWRSADGTELVRVAVGAFGGLTSPLTPAEPFTLLDVQLRRRLDFALTDSQTAVISLRSGEAVVRTDAGERRLMPGEALTAFGGTGLVHLESAERADLVILSGAELREPVVQHGPFVMNARAEIDDAIARYQAGRMGALEPYADS